MPSSPAYRSVNSLRAAYRRMWRGVAVGTGAAGVLLPLACVWPAPVWQRAVLFSLALVYLVLKSYRLRKTWKAVRQLRLEGCFIGHTFQREQLRRCIERRSHLWTHSYTVRALRRLMARPLPSLLRTDKKHRRVRAEYRRALAVVEPSRLGVGLVPGAVLAVGFFASSFLGDGDLPVWLVRVGWASAFVLLAAEGAQAFHRYHARRAFAHLTTALANWTLARSVRELLAERGPASYRHTPLYRAPAWFAARAPARRSAASEPASSRRRQT